MMYYLLNVFTISHRYVPRSFMKAGDPIGLVSPGLREGSHIIGSPYKSYKPRRNYQTRKQRHCISLLRKSIDISPSMVEDISRDIVT